MQVKDLTKPGTVAVAVALAAAVGFGAGWLLARNPDLARRAARALAGGWERISGALGESREQWGDLWAEVREDARATVEEEAFAAATAGAGAMAAAAAAAASVPEDTPPAAPKQPKPRTARTARTPPVRARSPRKPAVKTRRAASA